MKKTLCFEVTDFIEQITDCIDMFQKTKQINLALELLKALTTLNNLLYEHAVHMVIAENVELGDVKLPDVVLAYVSNDSEADYYKCTFNDEVVDIKLPIPTKLL